MTEPRDMQHQRQPTATTTDRDPEARPEVIQDLDVPAADDANIAGGMKSATLNVQQ
jgi:hypothetical protein